MTGNRFVCSLVLLLNCSLLLSSRQAPAVRFHHLHHRVDDPAAALNETAARLKGTRVIVQGLGVGVRSGSEYVLFDRSDDAEPSAAVPAAEAYTQAVAWLRERGLEATPARFDDTRLAAARSDRPIDHLAFAADDLDGAVAVLLDRGAVPVSRTAGSAMFTLPSGRLELVRSTDRPDAFWCPMHPDVRSADAVKCAVCGMDLVPIPPPRVGEYAMDVAVRDGTLRFVVHEPGGGGPVEHFANVHERPFHLFIVSRDLSYFAHEHPERLQDGAFELRQTLPPGEYMLIADFLPRGGTPQMLLRAVVTADYRGALLRVPRALGAGTSDKEVDGIRIRLHASDLLARRPASLRVTLSDAATGKTVEDLEPYLGAAAHMLIVNADLTEAIHAHPEETFTRGPSVSFDPVLPMPGKYKLWVQFQRKGSVVTVPFVIEVTE